MTDRFLLKQLRIQHFKAIRDSHTVDMSALTVFIGNNGSGKSSLIESIEAYSDVMINGLDKAFDCWIGVDNVWNKGVLHRRRASRGRGDAFDNPITMRLKGRWGRGSFSSLLELAPEVEGDQSRIEKEILKLPGDRRYERDRSGRCESFNDDTLERVRKVAPTEAACPQDWTNQCRRWQFLRLNPEVMGRPIPTRSPGPFPMLDRDGSNIGQYLLSLLKASPEAFQGLIEALQYVLPYARDLQATIADSIEKRVYLEMTEEEFKVPSWLLSTGTLRIVALLACLRHPSPPPLLIVEEIENGLDPRTLHLIVEEIRSAITSGSTQVILTTHSPFLLDLLDLSHIVVVEREDGQPVFRRPNAVQLAEWSKSFAPGQLYTMGRLTRQD